MTVAPVAVLPPGITANSVALANVVVRFGIGDVVAVSVASAGMGELVGGADVSVTGTGVPGGGTVAVSVGTAGMAGCVGATAVGNQIRRQARSNDQQDNNGKDQPIHRALLRATQHPSVNRGVRGYPTHYINREWKCAGL